ncbi:MAG TPA: peroxiredoxin [Burkholderiales bacterium]
MPIEIGARLPEAVLREKTDDGVKRRTVEELVRGRRVVIIGLPGAFTPTCSSRHVPSYLERAAELKAKGVDEILCVSVNDAFVMDAWARSLDAHGKIRMLADGNAEFTRAIGLESDRSEQGMGLRSQRYSMYVDDGVVRLLNIEAPGQYEVSDAGVMLSQLAGLNRA